MLVKYFPLDGELSNVTQINGDIVEGFVGAPSGEENNFCQITIESMKEIFFGEWKCLFNKDEKVSHIGSF